MEEVKVSVDRGIQKIAFNRPRKKNAISRSMYDYISMILDSSAKDDNIFMTVFTGEGDYYSSGNDISGYAATDVNENVDIGDLLDTASKVIEKFVSSFINYPKILVAIVNGPAIGIAATTLGLFDLVFASDKAYFLTPFTKLGLTAEGCSTVTFPKIMGLRKATEMLYFNYKMSAEEAKQYHFVSYIIPHSDLSTVWPKLHSYAALPRESLLSVKKLVRSVDSSALHAANKAECKELKRRWQSAEFFESMQNFLQKSMQSKL